MGNIKVQEHPSRTAAGGAAAMLIGLVLVVLIAVAVYFVAVSGYFGTRAPSAPNVTNAPAPASAPAAPTSAPGGIRYP